MPLFFFIFLLLAVYAEYSVIINVAHEIGGGLTFLAMIGTAVVGLWLVRLQGFGLYGKMNEMVKAGKSPVAEMLHGFLLLFAGVLLFIPGFITDAIGALLLIPPIRDALINMGAWKHMGGFTAYSTGPRHDDTIIEGEYTSEEKAPEDTPQIDKKPEE